MNEFTNNSTPYQQPTYPQTANLRDQVVASQSTGFSENTSASQAIADFTSTIPAHERKSEALRIANEMYRQGPDWVTFFREVLGVEGTIRKLFSTPEEMGGFEETEQYTEIQKMLAKLREKNRSQAENIEPTRVITVRLPKSLHESLKSEAHDKQTSMNKLCISKLLQVITKGLLPAE